MGKLQVSDIDLNLLVVLDVLLEELHVTRAAKRLHRTQSAVSHALSRLRVQLGDPLLVKVGGRMRATPRARLLAPEVHRLLGELQFVLTQPGEWEPRTSTRVFSVMGPDFTSAAFPALLQEMSKSAPHTMADLVPVEPSMFRDVAHGVHDVAFFRVMEPQAAVEVESLFSLPHVVFCRKGHPALQDWNLESWLKYPHIRIRMVGGTSPVDQILTARGLQRKIGPTFSNFLMVPPVLAESDMLFTAPFGILAHGAKRFNLIALPCPVPAEDVRLGVYTGVQRARDPAIEWFRGALINALNETFDRPFDAHHERR
jgi:LysR family transcriptional activator of mexEF-oprN operon